MVRFIIKTRFWRNKNAKKVYIPIWLDLLCNTTISNLFSSVGLHSNMVRFIINPEPPKLTQNTKFTFQYG